MPKKNGKDFFWGLSTSSQVPPLISFPFPEMFSSCFPIIYIENTIYLVCILKFDQVMLILGSLGYIVNSYLLNFELFQQEVSGEPDKPQIGEGFTIIFIRKVLYPDIHYIADITPKF